MLININLRFMTQVTRVLLPTLTKDKTQRTGIINVSSGAELARSAYLAIYAGTKAYISRFTLSLDAELRHEGHKVDMQSALVGMVATPGAQKGEKDISLTIVSARSMARDCLNKLGNGDVVCTPSLAHGMQFGALLSMPNYVIERFIINMTLQMKDDALRNAKKA
jgi:17beta-estradiol 17-dehydrogenase / very-long-chain 3-oxoacyl-CoA reductase